MRPDTYSKPELLKRLKRFCDDDNRYMPLRLFAQECGVSLTHFNNVFDKQTDTLTDAVQMRASIVLRRWERGEYKIMANGLTKEKYLVYRDEPVQRLAPTLQLAIQGGRITLKTGIRNKSDYGDKESLFNGRSA